MRLIKTVEKIQLKMENICSECPKSLRTGKMHFRKNDVR